MLERSGFSASCQTAARQRGKRLLIKRNVSGSFLRMLATFGGPQSSSLDLPPPLSPRKTWSTSPKSYFPPNSQSSRRNQFHCSPVLSEKTPNFIRCEVFPSSRKTKNKEWNAGTQLELGSGRWIRFAWRWNDLFLRVCCIIFLHTPACPSRTRSITHKSIQYLQLHQCLLMSFLKKTTRSSNFQVCGSSVLLFIRLKIR